MEVSVCVSFSKEKRKKMKERKERAGQQREKRWVQNEWWGVGLGGRQVGTKKSDLTPPPLLSLSLSLSLSDDRDVTATQLIIAKIFNLLYKFIVLGSLGLGPFNFWAQDSNCDLTIIIIKTLSNIQNTTYLYLYNI